MMNDTTRTYPRTLRQAFGMSPEDAQAIYVYRKPLAERILIWLLFRFGWALVLLAVETPPRAWGRLCEKRWSLKSHGNTPTGVGKTLP